MLQSDPALDDVKLILFDEFHERSLQADLSLALAMESQAILREDLKILVMSATLETESVSTLLGNAPIIRSEGKMFPIETFYLSQPLPERLEQVGDLLLRQTDALVLHREFERRSLRPPANHRMSRIAGRAEG